MKLSLGVAFVCGACLWAADGLQPLDVKLGQWETTSTSSTSGTPPIPPDVLARLTPDQRAKMEAIVKAGVSKGARATTRKSCLTKEDLAKASAFGDEQKSCTRTVVTSSGSKQEVRFECTNGAMKNTGTLLVEAVNSENVKGSIQIAATSGDRTMNVNSTFTSKWIGATCSEPPSK
jgi:hypothetical protein